MFLGYIHAFRGVAILIVLLGHARLLMPWPELRDSPWSLRLLSTLVEGGTVPFIFIAGYLFQHLAPRFEYGPFLRTKLKNVVAPYVVVSLPILAHAFVFRSGLYAERDAMGVREVVLVGAGSLLNARHAFVPYWFIPMICMVLLAAPALLAIDRRPKLYFGLLLAIPLAALLHRSELHVNPLQDAAHLLPVFVLGMLMSRYREAASAPWPSIEAICSPSWCARSRWRSRSDRVEVCSRVRSLRRTAGSTSTSCRSSLCRS